MEKQPIVDDKIAKVDPRVRRTRHMLLQAMKELMREKSFADITVQDITDRADLNRATFYKHFMDKYDLLNSMVRECFRELLDAALPPNSYLTVETVNNLIQTAFDYIANFHSSCLKVQQNSEHSMMMQQVQHQIYETLLAWLQQATPYTKAPRNSPEITAMLTSWTIFGPIVQMTCGIPKVTKQELIDQVKVLVYSMLEDHLAAEHVTPLSA